MNGAVVPNPHNSRNFNLGQQNLSAGSHELSATVTDPADPSGESEIRTWTVDNVLPTAPRTLSEPLTTLAGDTEHNVYFGEFTMGLEPTDDEDGFVVGEFRLNGDGWFNYFGFPDQPFGTPFKFSHSGTVVKALVYGNLGSGGMSKAAFEQSYPDFEPGYGTHKVEHRAIDASGNIGDADDFRATVLRGGSPECTETPQASRRRSSSGRALPAWRTPTQPVVFGSDRCLARCLEQLDQRRAGVRGCTLCNCSGAR